MIITFDKGKYICKCTFAERDIPKKSGFTFDPIVKKWVTSKPRNATRLRDYFDEKAKRSIDNFTLKKTPWSGRINLVSGEKLYPWQVEGVKYALSRNRTYLAFEQRLGKTPTSITILNSLPKNPLPALVIVPPFKFLDWIEDLKRWHYKKDFDFLGIGDTKELLGFEHPNDFEIILVSDTMINDPKINKFLKSTRFKSITVDEAHRFSNEGTNRTQCLYGTEDGLITYGEHVVLLSGTPLSNRPVELYPCLRALAWNLIDFMTYEQFVMKYCNGRYVTVFRGKEVLDASGASNTDLLRTKLSEFMTVEKLSTHADVIPIHRLVGISSDTDTVKVEALSRKHLEIKDFADYFEDGHEIGDISTFRKELAELKLKPATEFVLNKLQTESRQILIFGLHTIMVRGVYEMLKKQKFNVECIDGSVSKKNKQDIKLRYQNGEVDIIVAQVETMVGIDLYKGCYGLFLESPWSHRAVEQATSRLLSFVKKGEVFIDHLVLKGTFEEYILGRVLEKAKTINEIVKE